MVNTQRAVDLTIGLLSFEGFDVDKTAEGWQNLSGIDYVDAGGNNQRVHRWDIYGGYVGDRARRSSIIIQPSTRTTAYAEDQQLPVKVDDTFILAINVISKTFARDQQDQLVSVCDTIQGIIERYPDFVLGDWGEMATDHPTREPAHGEVWQDDTGAAWMVQAEERRAGDGKGNPIVHQLAPPLPQQLGPENAEMLIGENYIMVSSTDYNDEVQFGVKRPESVATIYVTVTANPHIGFM